MIRVKTVGTSADGRRHVQTKLHGEINELLNECCIGIRNINNAISAHCRTQNDMIEARTTFVGALIKEAQKISAQAEAESEEYRLSIEQRMAEEDARMAADEAEADLAERIWKSIQPEKAETPDQPEKEE